MSRGTSKKTKGHVKKKSEAKIKKEEEKKITGEEENTKRYTKVMIYPLNRSSKNIRKNITASLNFRIQILILGLAPCIYDQNPSSSSD